MWQPIWRCGSVCGCGGRTGVGFGVAGLWLELGEVDGAGVEARGRAGLEAGAAEAELLERLAEEDGGGLVGALVGAAGGALLLAAVDEAVEEGAGGDDGGGGTEFGAVAEDEALDLAGSLSHPFR